MGPDSPILIGLLFAVGGALIVLAMRVRRWFWRVPVIPLAMVACALGGMTIVNGYYGYYQTWSQLYSDLTGSYSGYTTSAAAHRHEDRIRSGQVREVSFAGGRSGIDRPGFVYLPPQYDQPRFAHVQFPVVELIHGSPGRPSDFLVHLDLAPLLNRLIGEHRMGPVIVVMPQMNAGNDYQDCVDGPRALDDTYISLDVRQDVLRAFRASPDPAQWGIAGYSSGGYCAANLALRHRASFGAAGIIDGYFRPADGPAAAALGGDPVAEAANNPMRAALALGRDSAPLPAFWVSAGSGDAADLAGAEAFARALHGVEQVDLMTESDAGHNFYAWRPALPRVLTWMWTQLAPPDLRVRFPLSGPVHGDVLYGGAGPRTVQKTARKVTA
jgi:enterochelin esterase-like enzyme